MTNLDSLIPTQKERLIACVSHLFILIPFLGFLAPRIIWASQKDKSQYVAVQSFQAFIYQVTALVIWLIGIALFYVLPIFGIWLVAPIINLIVRSILAAYGIFGAIMTFQGKPFRYWFISDRIERPLPAVADQQWLVQFKEVQKHPSFPFAVGFGIACIHFAITPIFEGSYYPSIEAIVGYIFMTPGYVLIFAIIFLLRTFELIDLSQLGTVSQFLLPVSSFFSSFYYGVIGGFLVSRKIYIQSFGIILVFLLILSICFVVAMLGQSFA